MTFSVLDVTELPDDNDTDNDFRISIQTSDAKFTFLASREETQNMGDALQRASQDDFSWDEQPAEQRDG